MGLSFGPVGVQQPLRREPAEREIQPLFQGAEFLTPLVDRRVETRRHMRDPDSHLIEVGQATALEWRTG